jgi:serine/threonine-protein kinase
MGEVWRATDTRLGRDVALKLLPTAFASDPDRLARLEREAKLLASLSHTHIAGLFALEEATLDGNATAVRFLAMELAEGEDLSERLKRGAIPVDEALSIARQIAEALEAAHEKGIVHRDLKPANVKVSVDDHVKVLDFGLAKAWSSDGGAARDTSDWSQSPTLARTGTAAGLILGTAAYMSPEQARGKPVDKRADVWAFGVLLFEMLTGKMLFDGETVSDVLAAVLTREPDWDDLPAATPASVRRLLRHCLERNPKNRQHDIADVRVGLEEAIRGVGEEAATAGTRPSWRLGAPWAALTGLLAVAAALASWAPWRETPRPPQALHLSVGLGAPAALTTFTPSDLALSPNGELLAYVAQAPTEPVPRIYLRPLHALVASPLSGTESARDPFFSPDSQWLAFFADGKLKKVATAGGTPVVVCPAPDDRGGTWSDDGTIVFMPLQAYGGGLSRVSSAGGSPQILTTPDQSEGPSTDRWPQSLPDGKAVLLTSQVGVGDYESADIVVQPMPRGPRKVLQHGGYFARYSRTGHLLFIHEGTLFAAPFDVGRLELTAPPVPVVTGVRADPFQVGAAGYAVSDRGTLVYVAGGRPRQISTLHWMDATGKLEPLRSIPGNYRDIRFSPDGQKLLMHMRQGRDWDVWIYEWARDAMVRFTSDPGEDREPIFTPDGRRIAFASSRGGKGAKNLYWQRADGTGDAQRLTESENDQYPASWHPNGKILVFDERGARANWDIWAIDLEGDDASGFRAGKPRPVLSSPFYEGRAAFSPDGEWLAYFSNESGRPEVYVRPFARPGGAAQVSTAGGWSPTWSPNRSELYFQAIDRTLMVAAYTVASGSFRAEKPRPWAPRRVSLWGGSKNYDLHPDGRRFAVLEPVDGDGEEKVDHVVFVQNIFDELRRLAPAAPR